jgi:hypothetical protein
MCERDREAARTEFDKAARQHGKLLLFGVLPLLKFDVRCSDQRFSFLVRWKPIRDGGYGVAVKDKYWPLRAFCPALCRKRFSWWLALGLHPYTLP